MLQLHVRVFTGLDMVMGPRTGRALAWWHR